MPDLLALGPRRGALPERPEALTFQVQAVYANGRTRTCRGPTCSAQVLHARTEAGKNMPLDWKTRVAVGDVYELESHFAHCPDARRFRRRGS